MEEFEAVIKRCDPGDWPASKSAPSKAAIETWEWFDVLPGREGATWDDERQWVRRALAAMIQELKSADLDAIVSFFGQVLPDGLIAVADVMIDAESGARFYLAPVDSMNKGPGYSTSFINIEYKAVLMDRLFERAWDAFGGTENTLAVYFVPTKAFEEVAHYQLSMYSVFGQELTVDELRVLDACVYLLLVNQDCDMLRVAGKGCHGESLLTILQKLWPGGMYSEVGR